MSGAAAGATSALVFAGIHAIFISDIWSMLVPMMLAGVVCGLCVGWTFPRVFQVHFIAGWLQYNTAYIGLFGLLGVVSVVVYEPITTIAARIEASDPKDLEELFRLAMPTTVVFTVAAAALLGLLFGRRWSYYGAILVTVAVLVILLGLNLSVIGLVDISTGSLYLIAETSGLIVAINLVFVAVLTGLEWKTLTRR